MPPMALVGSAGEATKRRPAKRASQGFVKRLSHLPAPVPEDPDPKGGWDGGTGKGDRDRAKACEEGPEDITYVPTQSTSS